MCRLEGTHTNGNTVCQPLHDSSVVSGDAPAPLADDAAKGEDADTQDTGANYSNDISYCKPGGWLMGVVVIVCM